MRRSSWPELQHLSLKEIGMSIEGVKLFKRNPWPNLYLLYLKEEKNSFDDKMLMEGLSYFKKLELANIYMEIY